jgi:hypothetical protein
VILTALATTSTLAVAADPPANEPAPTAAPAVNQPRQLPSLQHTPRWMTIVGCMTSGARFYKLNLSDASIYGALGYAFALNVHDKIDISGPTAWNDSKCYTLAGNIGLQIEHLHYEHDKDFAKNQALTWQKIRTALDQDKPCYAWAMDDPEYYVIFGYDGTGNYLFRNLKGQSGQLPHQKLSADWPIMAGIISKGAAADEKKTLTDALQFAVDVGAGKYAKAPYHAGTEAYDVWIKALQDQSLNAGEGNAYNAQCWAECRGAAALFLHEAASRSQDADTRALLEDAAASYDTVAAELKAVADLFPFTASGAMRTMYKDQSRRENAVEHLAAARDAEGQGLALLAQILAK